jgi:hypothetical protein
MDGFDPADKVGPHQVCNQRWWCFISLMLEPVPAAQVVVVAATSRANALDPAVRRPGRLDREIEIGR